MLGAMRLVPCEPERHAAAILAILNHAIVHSTALYDYRPRPIESMTTWFEAKRRGGYPVIGAESESGHLLGFATYGAFRAWPAYKYTVEHSVYVDETARRQGVGRMLLGAIVDAARADDRHVLIGGIDASNDASIALHVAAGFVHAGTI